MDHTEIQFCTATFGGFQKQDVLDYIEHSTKEHGDQLAALRRELEEVNQAKAALIVSRGELEAALSTAKEQAEALAAEQSAHSRAAVGEHEKLRAFEKQLEAEERRRAELEAALAGARGELERLKGEKERIAALEKDLAQARAQLEELQRERRDTAQTGEALAQARAELEKLRPAAEAYEHLKDRTAGIELEAHCRAQGVQAEAEERVRRTREQMERWLNQMRAEYGRLRRGMDATVAQAGEKLKATEHMAEEISVMLSSQDKVLEELTLACMAELKPQAPTPLPLEEK